MTITVTGPILLPKTPDCDYADGEALLSNEKIQNLVESYKDYQIIDYEHQFTNPESPLFMQTVGKPIRTFIVDEAVTFTDVSDTQITVPAGTAWLECVIDDPIVEKEIDEKLIVAYSVTVAEAEDAQYFLSLYNSTNNQSSNKSNETYSRHQRITRKRVLISDIVNPELLTVSVVKFPCVYKAKFCKRSIKHDEDIGLEYSEKGDNMTEDYTNETFIENIKTEVSKLLGSNKEDTEQKQDEEETETQEPVEQKEPKEEYVTSEELDEKLDNFKAEIISEVVDAISQVKEEDAKDKKEEEPQKEQEEEKKEAEKTTSEEETEEENEGEDQTEEPKEEQKGEPIPVKSSVGKAFSKKAEENKIKNKTAQPSRKSTLKHEGGQTSMKTIHERDLISNAIKGDGTSIKSALKDNTKIIYNTREYNLVPYYQHKGVLNGLNKAGKHVFQESFSEEETNKAILSTELFAQYVRELITPEAIFDQANYMTVYGEEAPIRRVKAAKSWTSQDGHLPANYYFDNIPEASELLHEKDVVRPVTQRDLFTISDRQLRNNVFGDDLLDVSLETIKETFYNGVYAARILGDTDNDGQTYTPTGGSATDIDKQFTRKDGWVKQAGVQLESTTDFDADNILDLFDTMYYSLPEYAQQEGNYAFFVPSQVRRAFYNHFIKNSRESKIDLVSEQRALYFNNIPILTSKTLSSAEFRNMLTGGDAKVLLTNPQNTILGVGRSFGIEPERHADTSSTYYYLTLDTDAKYAKPEEAVVATIGADDYATLPVTTEP